jgi:hypothetical protein
MTTALLVIDLQRNATLANMSSFGPRVEVQPAADIRFDAA